VPGAEISELLEPVFGPEGARVRVDTQGKVEVRPVPTTLRLPADGEVRYRLERGLCRSVAAAAAAYRPGEAFDWVGLFAGMGCAGARLVLRGLPAAKRPPFGTATDLGTGREWTVPVERADGAIVLRHAPCRARTLLRIYWALETEEG